MSSETFLVNEVDIANINIGTLKTSERGGISQGFINFNGSALRLQLPKMYMPYGISDNIKFIKDDTENKKYWINLSFGDYESNSKYGELKSLIESINEKIIDSACENHQAWFKKPFKNRDIVEEKFNSSIIYSKDKSTGEIKNDYPPTFKVNLKGINDNITTKFFDSSRNEIDDVFTKKTKGTNIITIIYGKLWISSSGFGISWKVDQAQIFLNNSTGNCIIKDNDDEQEEDIEDNTNVENVNNSVDNLKIDTNIEDSDDDL